MSEIRYIPYYGIFKNVRNTQIRAQYNLIMDELFGPDQDTGVLDHFTLMLMSAPYPGGWREFSSN